MAEYEDQEEERKGKRLFHFRPHFGDTLETEAGSISNEYEIQSTGFREISQMWKKTFRPLPGLEWVPQYVVVNAFQG